MSAKKGPACGAFSYFMHDADQKLARTPMRY